MVVWLGASLAWLLGVALRLLADGLPSAMGALLGMGLGTLGVLVAWRLWRPSVGRLTPGKRRLWGVACLWSGLLLLAWGSTGWRAHLRQPQATPLAWQHGEVGVEVRVVGLPQERQGRWRFEAQVLRWLHPQAVDTAADTAADIAADTWPDHLQLHMAAPGGDAGLRAGQLWRLTARLHPPDGLFNPGLRSATLLPFARGVQAVGQVRAGAVRLPDDLADPPGTWLSWQLRVDRLRQDVRERLVRHLGPSREAGILAGLSMGDQAAIPSADWEVLRRSGTAHLVSISGAHVAMLGVLCAWAVRRAWSAAPMLARRLPAPLVGAWVAMWVSTAYAWFSGWGVPAQRTVWMMAVAVGLLTLGRRWPWALTWLLCAAIVSAFDPWSLCVPGFWLSFVAVGVLLASGLAPMEAGSVQQAPASGRWWQAARRSTRELLQTQRLVAVALTPVALVCFQQVSVVGVAVNLVAVPVFTALITPLALAGALWSGCWDAGAWVVGWVWVGLQGASDWPWAVLQTPELPAWVAVSGVLASFALALPGRWRWRGLAWPFLLPFLVLPDAWQLVPPPPPGRFTMIAADVGQGGAVLVRTARHALLFDTGARRPDGSDVGERVLLPLLRALGVGRLDELVISHEDIDHVGGAASLLNGIDVRALRTTLEAGHPLLQQAAMRSPVVPHTSCEAGASWVWDGVSFEVLHPFGRRVPGEPDNARSCVIRVQASLDGSGRAPASLLLTGDIEAPQEQALLEARGAAGLRSTVLIVPHHGSRTSSSRAWLQAVEPVQAVVQAGVRNRDGHPHALVMDRHRELGVAVATSPRCGAHIWRSDEAERTQEAPHEGRPRLGRCWREGQQRHWELGAGSSVVGRP